MQALPRRAFPEVFPQFVLFRIVLTCTILTQLTQNSLKVFPKKGPDRVRRLETTPPSPYMTNLIDINDLRARFKLGRTAAYQTTTDPSFPAAIYLNARTKRWEVAEVEEWLQGRKGLKSPPRRKSSRIKVSDVIDGVRFERVGA